MTEIDLKKSAFSEKHLIAHGKKPFTNDPWFGRQLLPGQDFIGEADFLSLDDAAAEIKASNKRVLLNIGDSSTAGWDTRVTAVNKQRLKKEEPLILAFFQYPNYSDVLRQQAGEQLIVLNAGIPGHTTLQGVRRNRKLLEGLKERGITPDYVSFYFGNNDCQWENNVEDKYLVRSNLPLFLDKQRIKHRKPDFERIHLRTNLRDFEANVRMMLRDARHFGAIPMVILPETPIYWEPGFRFVADNFLIKDDSPGANMVNAALAKATKLWENAKDTDWSVQKAADLSKASELDFVIPRIKTAYRKVLESVARNANVPLVRTRIPREDNDIEYFVDYCHPIGDANVQIATKLQEMIKACDEGHYADAGERGSLLMRLLDSNLFGFIGRVLSRGKSSSTDSDASDDIYTLY